MVQLAKGLPNVQEGPRHNAQHHTNCSWCMAAHSCNSSTMEVEAGGSGIQDYPHLHREFEVSLTTKDPYLTIKQAWWQTPLILGLGRQRQADCYGLHSKFQAAKAT